MIMSKKRGLSPVIATVLLIAIVIVIGLIIFIWARGFIKESGTKLGKSANQNCEEINIEASLDGTTLSITNRGQIPIYKINLQKTSAGSTDVETINEKIAPGGSTAYELGGTYQKVNIIPVILVEVKGARQPFSCDSFKKEVVGA
jgi:flagellin-like protein